MWPVKRKKEPNIPVNLNRQSTPGTNPGDNLWASLRRLRTQVESLELALSAAKRDINRIDRAQYREKEKLPATEEKEPVHSGLFG